jgi:hypothetical protein
LKLVSGAILTIAMSASAMVGATLVGFLMDTTNILPGEMSTGIFRNVFGMPDASLSSCRFFSAFSESGLP